MSTILFTFLILVGIAFAEEESLLEKIEALDDKFQTHISRIDMLIKFYHPEWSQSASCGRGCPYRINLLEFAAVQWKFEGPINGGHDLEFSDNRDRIHGNMDFYERHMYLWNCGRIDYETHPPKVDGPRTWTFVKTTTGFKLYCETTLLVDYTYKDGKCAELWRGATTGFFFESPVQFHLLQHGMDMFWFTGKRLQAEDNESEF